MRKRSLGLAFKDELSKVSSKHGHFKQVEDRGWEDLLLPNFDPDDNQESNNRWRLTVFLSLALIIFFAFFLRLFNLQIVKGAENRNLADGNRIQIKMIHAPRGVIFDRNSKILAANEPGFRLKSGSKIYYISRDEALKLEALGHPDFKNLEVDSIRSYPQVEVSAHILGSVSEITPEELKSLKGYRIGDRLGRGGIEESYEKFLKGVDGGEVVEVDARGEV